MKALSETSFSMISASFSGGRLRNFPSSANDGAGPTAAPVPAATAATSAERREAQQAQVHNLHNLTLHDLRACKYFAHVHGATAAVSAGIATRQAALPRPEVPGQLPPQCHSGGQVLVLEEARG
eukprot:CAMPEP_0171098160 /NCGR_PEP_ID=MMETSP0766_2-20121228/47964_1 /TAXON_ID=439317 /ORGANISM="Gambierdiscus australes, Strain CAWD 149" /LENGTH=123 /DNA_ID=CAMNT_0011557467 /DNA_START=459 /DNA_END=831 /DNA_ORIENTATION=+